MDLLEYQAKQLFTRVGIPVLPSQPISSPGELKNLHIPYPIVLKSQVSAGGRGKAGGVKFVTNTIDAIAAAQTIFKLAIEGEYPEVVLAEARYDPENEFFLAVMLDYQLKRPVLLGSSQGGIDIESLLENMQTCVVEEEFSPFYARRLATKMGLKGKLIESVSKIVEKMYHLFWEKDLEIVEINPLGIGFEGELMALDGKIRVNERALARHPELLQLMGSNLDLSSAPLESDTQEKLMAEKSSALLFSLDSQGKIALICNSVDLGILTANLILENQGKVAACLVVEPSPCEGFPQQLATILEQISTQPQIEVILVNILASEAINRTVIEAITNYEQCKLTSKPNKGEERMKRPAASRLCHLVKTNSEAKTSQRTKPMRWILRLVGGEVENLCSNLTNLPLEWTETIETAINLALSHR
jgi:succinyl-CoA synthetase beta subunit